MALTLFIFHLSTEELLDEARILLTVEKTQDYVPTVLLGGQFRHFGCNHSRVQLQPTMQLPT